ncbi:chemotaxis-specific protein-glutamate methyltransferase CheB [Candidatus Parcubacteria bacterium]|nr:chemotaxis-specific protein-glutamate methyltransferase CheB [Patescibacteria group bacterium]MBU4309386.1 chemotaxis-specific protein-glutamate methyltransferase CheB [Patescibacteria group bacterium]MBU4432228.1 chemotaxis-specific protein-glutamate methyltransferase CheB [Patescibacteria group bacterium]MBU4577747.1 chemotaxis-specific protein-glutamate methyltransferase CheB [Patescibacteria group bacterium]MCG2697432.1 chemotaxis-specific protein-glutamate methyltransferase CheB [Candid
MNKDEKIRLLIVDDSFLTRKILIELLKDDPEIDIVGEAIDGEDAFLKTKILRPDVITMDYNMPLVNGLEAIKKIKAAMDIFPAILMVSGNTMEGATETLECLKHGAIDFIPKPSGELSLDIKKIQRELINKIKIAAKVKKTDYKEIERKEKIKKDSKISVVVIGASTGGPPVIEEIISSLAKDIKAPILVVQHMPEHFTASLANRLDGLSELSVVEASEGEELLPGKCIIARGGKHMLLNKMVDGRVVIHLDDKPLRNGFRPSIDYTMESVAKLYGKKTMGIVLTGMGRDGSDGMVEIENESGYTITQLPEEAVVDSMPRSAWDTGVIDESLGVKDIIKKIKELCF